MLLLAAGLGLAINLVNPIFGFMFILLSIGITASIIKESLRHYLDYKSIHKELKKH